MDENMGHNEVCRLCLSKKDKTLHIFSQKDPGEDSLTTKIRACVGVEVLRGDGFPKHICLQCSCHINLWYYFKQDCARSQTKLKSWRSQVTRSNESHSEVDEVIHIKQEPPDYTNESFRERTSDELPNGPTPTSVILEQSEDGIDDNEDEDVESSNPMNLIIMDTTTIPADNLTCQGDMGSTVIELQPEDEDLLRTVVESEDGIRNEEGNENEVTILHVGKDDAGVDMMEEITLDEDSSHSSAVEEDLEEDVESAAVGGTSQSAMAAPVPVPAPGQVPVQLDNDDDVQLVQVKQEKEDWSWPANNGAAAAAVTVAPSTSRPAVATSMSMSMPMAMPHPIPTIWKCPKCPRSFPTSKTRNIHLTKGHRDKQKGPTRPREPIAHADLPKIVNAMYDEENMVCKMCDRKYPSTLYLWRHLRQSHDDRKPFACQVCRRVFHSKRELTSHRLRTISKHCRLGKCGPPVDASKVAYINTKIPAGTVGRFTCKECSAPFKCLSLVKKHFTIHSGEMPYECPKCKQEYREYKTASIHFKVCNAPLPFYKYAPIPTAPASAPAATAGAGAGAGAAAAAGARFKCQKCTRVFSHYSTYWKHKKRGCEEQRFCNACSQSVPLAEWERHAASCIPIEKSPSTYVRKKVERTSMALQDILAIHRGMDDSQELKCKLCSNVFGSKKSLGAHIRKHSALPSTPSFSPRSFSPSASPLSSLSSLKCDICNLSVQHESTLRSHMESYHGQLANLLLNPSVSVSVTPSPGGTPTVRLGATNPLVAKHKARLGAFTSSKLKCDQCHKLFSSMSALQFHKRTHKPRDIATLTCPICKKVFMTPNALANHKKIHASLQLKLKMYKCTFCGNCYSDAKDLQVHKMSEHGEEEAAAAASASSVTSPSAAVGLSIAAGAAEPEVIIKEEAEGTATPAFPPRPWKCDICSKIYTAESSLIRHKKLHEASQPISKFRCETCNKSFLSAKSFDSHKGWHSRSSSTLPPLITTKLSSKLASSKLALHAKMKTQKFYCPVCNKAFLHKANCKRHMIMQNHNYKGPPTSAPVLNPPVPDHKTEYRCKVCSDVFIDIGGYKRHLREHKMEPSGGASSATGEAQEEGHLVCKLCKKTLRSLKGYRKHLEGHSNQKPFKCDVCSNQYSSETALTKHKQDKHEFKAFACNKCKACFTEKEELISHYEKCSV